MKIYIKELYYYYKFHKVAICILVLQIVILFILFGTFFAFFEEISYGKGNLERIYKDKAIYQLLDGYFEPKDFEEFRRREDALEILKSYYEGLNEAKSFQYLAMFNQGILIADREEKFFTIEALEDGITKRMESFQLNQQAHDYFGITVTKGRGFIAEDFLDTGKVAILVGSNYEEEIEVGDEILISYYQKEMIGEVVGIVAPDTYVYFNQNPEYYLDHHIILPYPNYSIAETVAEKEFQKIAYFAMVNGYIAIANQKEATKMMMLEVEQIAQQSKFYNYLFIGSNPNTQVYKGLLNVISHNYTLVQLLFTCCFILNSILISFQIYLMQKKRLHFWSIHYLNGCAMSQIVKQCILEISSLIFLGVMLSQMVLTHVLKLSSTLTLFKLNGVAIFLIVSVSVIPLVKLKKREFITLLNVEEEYRC